MLLAKKYAQKIGFDVQEVLKWIQEGSLDYNCIRKDLGLESVGGNSEHLEQSDAVRCESD